LRPYASSAAMPIAAMGILTTSTLTLDYPTRVALSCAVFQKKRRKLDILIMLFPFHGRL
jgi:hypothetical protein